MHGWQNVSLVLLIEVEAVIISHCLIEEKRKYGMNENLSAEDNQLYIFRKQST
jgi:hypothetical protein